MEFSELHPWPVVRDTLFELSSHEIPRVTDQAGLKIDWELTKDQDYSNKTRISAYRPKIDTAFNRLSEENQLRVAFIVASKLATYGFGETLKAALKTIGWGFESGKLVPETAAVREKFFTSQSQHDSYVEIRRILQSASSSIFLVDPYIDQTLLTLLTSANKSGLTIRVLTAKPPKDFTLEIEAWLKQYTNISLEVRTTREFHDRFIIIDKYACWHIGCSIKDAGNKAFMLSNVKDVENRNALLKQIEKSWQNAERS